MAICIVCPEPYSNEWVTIPEVEATHKYNQLDPMCQLHYEKIVEIVESITHNKVTEGERARHRNHNF